MALIELTPLQWQAGTMLLKIASDAIARHATIKDMSDEQCQILIDHQLEVTENLDKRLEGH